MPKNLTITLLILIASGLVILFHYFPDISSNTDKFNVMYYLIFVAMISGGLVARFRGNISGAVKHSLIWLAGFIALVLLYSFRNDLIIAKERILSELIPSRATITREGVLKFNISSDGHFYINTLTNEKPIRFMLDTGASDVVIPPHIAQALGFDNDKLNFTKIYNTANGQGRGAPIIIKTMQIGNYNFNDIKASVNETEMDSPLLGMSFLEKLSGYEVENGVLSLRP